MKIKRLEVVEEFGKKKLIGNAISLNFNGSEIAVMANTTEELQRIGRNLFGGDFVVDKSLIVKCELARFKGYEVSLTQETVTVYVDGVAFEVGYAFNSNYKPSYKDSNFDIVALKSNDPETGEEIDLFDLLKLDNLNLVQELSLRVLMIADSEWQKAANEIKSANECDNSRW